MRRRPRNHPPRSGTLAARIDHAAEEINPFLAVIAVGLIVLNLVALAFLSPRLSAGSGGAASVKTMPGPRLTGIGAQ
jgi:hypothetical protein